MLPPEIGLLTQLHHLDVSYNRLKVYMLNLFLFLWFGYGSLGMLQSVRPELRHLRCQHVNLKGNFLQGFVNEFENLTALVSLTLSHNCVAAISSNISELMSLTRLVLDRNQACVSFRLLSVRITNKLFS
jgi:Leucine-rich repeat (LRR) protein